MDAPSLSPEDLHRLLLRAARSVNRAVRSEEPVDEPAPNAALEEPWGVFVTLRKKGRLAGCIGFVHAHESVWSSSAHAAVAAALSDPRFPPLRKADLKHCSIEISVLSEPQPIEAEEVVVGEHGLIIHRGIHSGLLLPQVATEHGLDREAFLRALCRKAALSEEAWRGSDCDLNAFTVQTDEGDLADLLLEGEKS